ncbi:prepilin peptidase [Verminephrobacter aporrectodeae]|uniref:Prepilin leader peptidase/N-methyltransferase n=2 Tax=Verminephrobacter TaxID=364316 RepID=A0ABT3KVR8_9BURK|nr:A24 family peptidase [Verminephrobacter aporrectodeae]MCW5322087.1 prepilin peptidase [Verminephrobacter aporrectodeae subsp. tuberculatae]MCW8174171.1 prepilin peptidase [Verminephrobacter aporrectodeae subsp. tuberculatae]MCW8197431.1 prepilin peptidase [Verminephrobacter aporrectodeae subsp. tuberculatae]MCW8201860.1 prepilin peptidase [Verminephrobacter aporrectodeae subsp. tuberculatae]MCW8205858.1 prepilin peptidase [Verminephrobacter aporrectodeae subsp. tuberculatae]
MALDAWWGPVLGGVLGLLFGSFLNVVIYRLPKMMERQWAAERAALAWDTPNHGEAPPAAAQEVFNLMTPRSRCPSCGHAVRWYENVPILSYLFLRGRCSACKTRISIRYPLVEAVTGAVFFFCLQRWGISAAGMAWCGFCAALIALTCIDWDTTLLPDDITLPLLWAGLLASAMQWIAVPLYASVVGAAAGYLSLWLVYWGFKCATGKEGMGYGDFKLFAALGAWFGWQALVPIILLSSVIGAVIGIVLKLLSALREGGYIPFGPFLAGAGFTALVFGPQAILDAVLQFVGL